MNQVYIVMKFNAITDDEPSIAFVATSEEVAEDILFHNMEAERQNDYEDDPRIVPIFKSVDKTTYWIEKHHVIADISK